MFGDHVYEPGLELGAAHEAAPPRHETINGFGLRNRRAAHLDPPPNTPTHKRAKDT